MPEIRSARSTSEQPSDDPLLAWRSEFPILERTNYLVNNSLGAMPRATRASLDSFADSWAERGVRAWGDSWWGLQGEVAGYVESLLGVASGTVSMHQNTAMASQVILSCFDFSGPRNKVVFTDLQFPSVMYLYEAQVARGAEIVRVPAAADGITVDLQRLLDAIDEQTLLVPISHVLFRSGFIQDAEAIVRRAREVGAFVVLDVFQSVGALPLRLEEWGVHAAVGGALKYCCGGPGNCFLYVAPQERAALKPAFTGWAAHVDPFAFSADGQEYREDGGRFLNGTPNVPALYAGREGLRIVAEVGTDAIRAKSLRITQAMIERAQGAGIAIKSPLDSSVRGNHLSLDVPDGYAVCQALAAEEVVVDYRPAAGLRISPHFYNTPDEALGCVDRIIEILATDAHQRFKSADRKPG